MRKQNKDGMCDRKTTEGTKASEGAAEVKRFKLAYSYDFSAQ